MNQDIAYNVLSFLENPQQYGRVSQSFQQGSIPAQREYINSNYPLLTMSVDDMYRRLYPGDGMQESRMSVEKMMENLVLFYLNKMALNKQWNLFYAALGLMDREVLRGAFPRIIDMLHINDNDAAAAELWRMRDRLGARGTDVQDQYYEFYSSVPTDEKAHNYPVGIETIGYIPEEVIAYWDRYPDEWMNTRSTPENVLPAIMRRGFLPREDPRRTLQSLTFGAYDDRTWDRIIAIARDHPYENMGELITYVPSDVLGIENIHGISQASIHTGSVPLNRRILQYVKDYYTRFINLGRRFSFTVASEYNSAPIVLAYLRDLWINNPEQMEAIGWRADENRYDIRYIPNYISFLQSQKIPINMDEILGSFAQV